MTVSDAGLSFVLKAQDLTFIGGVLAIIIASLFQWLSKNKKPWTWLWNKFTTGIANAVKTNYKQELSDINENLTAITGQVNLLQKQVNDIQEDNKRQDAEREKDKALTARRHIIAAADELRRRISHSDEWYNSILEDCTFYENYCKDNPKFPNEKAVASIALIRKKYDARLDKG